VSAAGALAGAVEQWNTNVFPSDVAADLPLPSQFEDLAKSVDEEQVRKAVLISSDLAQHAAWIEQARELDLEALYLHNVNRDQRGFIEAFGREVLPQFR
jgi:hypothetical protein